jgi:predicted DCC family thiol-disulfide oxidoreductase YuxK
MRRQLMSLSPSLEPAPSPAAGASCPGPLTVYFDGSCPLCATEISYYARQPAATEMAFVDASRSGADTGADLAVEDAVKRFHVRLADGRLLSGAAAFVAIWDQLPAWRWAARVARLPGGMAMLELAYRAFLPVRPLLSRLAGKLGLRAMSDPRA